MGKGLCAKMGMWMAVMLLAGAGAMAQSSHPVAGKYAVTASSPELGEIKFQIMLEHTIMSLTLPLLMSLLPNVSSILIINTDFVTPLK